MQLELLKIDLMMLIKKKENLSEEELNKFLIQFGEKFHNVKEYISIKKKFAK